MFSIVSFQLSVFIGISNEPITENSKTLLGWHSFLINSDKTAAKLI